MATALHASSTVSQLAICLQPKQMALWDAIHRTGPDAPTFLGYGGSRGAAKSGGVRRIALGLALEKPVVIWIIRRIWDDLNKDHVKPLFAEFPELEQYWHAVDRELRLPVPGTNRTSSIFFIHSGDAGRSKRKSRGPQAHYIFLEQAEEFSEEEMEALKGSNRAPGVAPGTCKRIFTFNPGGIGTDYLRRVLLLKQYREHESAHDFLFIQAYGWDNYEWFRGLGTVDEAEFYNDPEWTACAWFVDSKSGEKIFGNERAFLKFVRETDFGRNLDTQPASMRIGELLGSFERFAGQYYADVWEPASIVLDPVLVARIIKPWWYRWLGNDWGFSHYAATGWACAGLLGPQDCLDYFGVEAAGTVRIIIVYRELVTNRVPEPELARLIVAMTPEAELREIRSNYIGHDAWAGEGKSSGHSVVEQMDPIFRAGGVPTLDRADIDRVGGWRLLYNCFNNARRFRQWRGPDPFTDRPEDEPILFISAACPEIIGAIPLLMADYDPITNPRGNPKDIHKMNGRACDDVADMLRYAVKSHIRANPTIPPDVERMRTWNKYEDMTSKVMNLRREEAERSQRRYIRRGSPA